ncbi:MAG: terpene cyclase/mutase family protein, partial [Lachnospiraceae bacterium]|nr:terpene cyclase/mutase family protein [Lachnospiraceae bacterium]
MKNKIFAILCIAILLLTNTTVYAKENTAGEVSNALGGIVSYKVNEAGAKDAQSWLDGALTEGAGVTSEWYVAGLTGSDTKYNFDSYKTALEAFVNVEKIQSATTREKYALLLILTGSDSKFIGKTADDSIGKAGIISLVFGLHLLNNGVESKEYTADKLVDEILSLRLSDGGWALMGKVSDVDVTAMTIAALAPYYESNETVKTSVDEALTLLSARQNEAGDFAGFGKDNAESTAQVLFALSSLGIDSANDERFIKGENTVIDGLLKYKNSDGSFSHEEGGAANESATAQSFYAFTAYERMINGKGPLFIAEKGEKAEETQNEDSPIQGSEEPLSKGKSEDDKEPDKSDPDASAKEHKVWEPEANTAGSTKSPEGNTAFSYKPIATGIVAAL